MTKGFWPMSRCTICAHPEKWRIELLRAGGASLESLAQKFSVGKVAIHRHWHNHVTDEMRAGYLAGPVQLQELAAKAADTGTSVLDNLHAVRVILMGHLATATEAGDGNMAANIASRLTHTLETIAKISGELGALATNATFHITNNVQLLAESPAFMRVQACLLRALAPFPDARAAVVSALRECDESAPVANPARMAALPPRIVEHARP
jgi:hypothetical protein